MRPPKRSVALYFSEAGVDRMNAFAAPKSKLKVCSLLADDVAGAEMDLSQPAAPAELFRQALQRFGCIDILVNNAAHWEEGGILLLNPKRGWGISLPHTITAFAALPWLVLCITMTVPPVFASDLIAYYRFDTNGTDCLGKSPPFLLTNGQWKAGVPPAFVVTNAPFTNGVLHVNGLYEPNGHFVHYLGTAPIQGLRYDSFTVSLDFYPLPQKRSRYSLGKLESMINSWTRDRYLRWRSIDSSMALFRQDNILTGGYSHRWIGFNREAGVLNLTLNNQSFTHRFKGAAVKPGRWHNLICSVDLRRRQIVTMFDGQLLETVYLPSDFKLEVIDSEREASDREFTFADHSSGSVFYGYLANLKVFARGLAGSDLAGVYSASLGERPNFPKRSFAWPTALVALATSLLAVVGLRQLWLRRRHKD